jgi:hypothetical protein
MSEVRALTTKLGTGSFGSVFTWISSTGVAIKQVLDESRCGELEEEFKVLRTVYRDCDTSNNIFKFPEPFSFYSSLSDLLEDMSESDIFSKSNVSQAAGGLNGAACIFTMERVNQIPKKLASLIVSKYFPAVFKQDERPSFVCRLYLGSIVQKKNNRFFSTVNFPLSLTSCIDIGLDVNKIAYNMGQLLSEIHFKARMDARDVEFILGGASKNALIETGYWCIDFNQTALHRNSVDQMVEAYTVNDRYFPRCPEYFDLVNESLETINAVLSVWTNFVDGYSFIFGYLPTADRKLGRNFINEISSLRPGAGR